MGEEVSVFLFSIPFLFLFFLFFLSFLFSIPFLFLFFPSVSVYMFALSFSVCFRALLLASAHSFVLSLSSLLAL